MADVRAEAGMTEQLDLVQTPRGLASLSLDAALEIESVIQKKAAESPSFKELVSLLREPRITLEGSTVSMLADVRSRRILRSVIPQQRLSLSNDAREIFQRAVDEFLENLLKGIATHKGEELRRAKAFCLALNQEVITKRYETLISRHREPQRSRRAHAS